MPRQRLVRARTRGELVMRTDRVARIAAVVKFAAWISVAILAHAESLWDHYRSNRIDVAGRSFPERVERFDLDVMGDQRPELFVSDSGAIAKNGSRMLRP